MLHLQSVIRASAAALVGACVASAAAADQKADALAILRAQADRWDQAIVAKRRADIEANMADDFRQIDGAGTIETKQSFVEGLIDPKLTIDPYTVDDFEVRLYGDVALLSGRTRMTGTYDGKAFTSHYRYIDIYVRKGGAWKIVSVQFTKLPQ
jgi:ketosteroid isomerase-like protein